MGTSGQTQQKTGKLDFLLSKHSWSSCCSQIHAPIHVDIYFLSPSRTQVGLKQVSKICEELSYWEAIILSKNGR